MYQRVRLVLFYLSIIIFFVSVPVSLIFSLGYNITWRTLQVYRAGLINVDTNPSGAQVYLNNRDTGAITPAILKELKPEAYDLKLQLEGYYPWQNSVAVKEGVVTELKTVTLFRRIPHLEKVNTEEVTDFALNKNHEYIFLISKENNFIYKVDSKGKSSSVVYKLPFSAERIKKWAVSGDGKNILYVAGNKLYVGFLFQPDLKQVAPQDFFITVPEEIWEVFWHADSEHIIVVSAKDIRVYEILSQGKNNIISLTPLNLKRPKVFYDVENNALYFTDLQETSVGKYSNLYKIQLGRRQVFPFREEFEK